MKKLITLCVMVLLTIQSNFANNFITDNELIDGSISGKVIDAVSNEPLPYVNIIIKNEKYK